MTNQLTEGIDFNYDENGLMILTRDYLLKRGRCCQSGCQNCPYGYGEKVDPSVPAEFSEHPEAQKANSEEIEIYSGDIPEEFL
jgi:hypothetical protein